MQNNLTTTASQLTAANDITAAAVVDMFLAEKNGVASSKALYRRALKQFFTWADQTGRAINLLTTADIIAYKDELLATKSSLTVASYINAVKLFYAWLHNNNATVRNIAAGVVLPKAINKFKREPLTNSQAGDLIREATAGTSKRDAAIIELLVTSGLRTIEVVRANVNNICLKKGCAVLKVQGKGHADADDFTPLSASTYAAIMDYLHTERPAARPTEPLFTCAGNRNVNGRMTTRSISRIARRHLDAIGLTKNPGERNSEYTAHSLRHTYACTMLRASKDYSIVQLLLRHSDPATTRKYTGHIDEERKLEAAQKFNIDTIYTNAK